VGWIYLTKHQKKLEPQPVTSEPWKMPRSEWPCWMCRLCQLRRVGVKKHAYLNHSFHAQCVK
jgi:hypothetical protein